MTYREKAISRPWDTSKWLFKILTDFDRIKATLGNDKGNEGIKKDGPRCLSPSVLKEKL